MISAGPIFVREALTAPRRFRHFLMRSGFLAGLLVLLYSVRQATLGFQDVFLAGDIAGFSNLVFHVFAMLLLTLGLFFSTLFSAANVAQEKDRRTLILLLMTDMRNHELAIGKLLASVLIVGVLLASTLPVFALLRLLGGVTWPQILWTMALMTAGSLAAGCWGCLVAFWREKSFQTLSISVLGVILFIGGTEGLCRIVGPATAAGSWLGVLSPYRCLNDVLNPLSSVEQGAPTISAAGGVAALLSLAVLLTAITILRLRVWNPSRSLRQLALELPAETEPGVSPGQAAAPAVARVHRRVWDNPVMWREVRTRAYGRRIIWIKLVYVLLSAVMAWSAVRSAVPQELVLGMVSPAAFAFLGIAVVSLLLMNAQAVTSITNERDGRTLEILLVADMKALEFMAGKLAGAAWNAREMIVLPLLLLGWMSATRTINGMTPENGVYVTLSWLFLSLFSITLGLHSGLTYDNSRSAIGNSLGTMFFLFIGIFVFMLLLVEARSSFSIQLQSFILFIGFGSLGLHTSLTHRNPSSALTLASMGLPFLTYYAITEFLLGGNLGVCLAICLAYGFAVVAMLIPAITDFDIVLGRNAVDAG